MVQGTIQESDFTDAWHIDLKPGSIISIDLIRLNSDLAFDVALYGPDGKLITIPKAGTNSEYRVDNLDISAGGTYTLIVSRAGGAAGHTSGDYQLQVTVK
jgi:hypothetical protein